MRKVAAMTVSVIAIAICYSFAARRMPTDTLSFKGAPTTREQLGEQLFFEKKLSATRTVSCASCHIPAHGFADTLAFSKGVHGHTGKRNAPTCTNVSGRPYLFYDGRAATLEDQVKFPIEDTLEMGLPIAEAVSRLQNDKDYMQAFSQLFGSAPTEQYLKEAIAAFERTLETSHTPFDRYMAGDSAAISTSAKRGRLLFMGKKAKCFDCHYSPDFTGDEFRNIGLYDGVKLNDAGRFDVTGKDIDKGKFKVPGLRNIAVTAPYMHNGMFKTLKEVIEYYNDPYKVVGRPLNADSLVRKPLHLTAREKQDLENFMLTLTDDRFVKK